MNRDNPANRWLLFGAATFAVLPFLAFLFFNSQLGLLTLFRQPMSVVSLVLVVCLLGYLLAIWLVFFRGRLFASALVILVCAYLQTGLGFGLASRDAEDNQIYQLDFAGFPPQKGIEVYCNDVHIGTSPFMLRESEFQTRISPRETPPKQPRVIGIADEGERLPNAWTKLTWMPSDPFSEIRGLSSIDHSYFNDNEKLNEKFASARYWWRFERDGCSGLTRVGPLSSGGGGGRVLTFNVNFDNIFYPSQQPHFERIMEAARAADFRPGKPWLDHFFRYQPFFENELFAQAKTNLQIDALIDYIAAARYDIPEMMDERTAGKLLDRLLDEAEQEDRFVMPSLANRAALRIGRKYPHLISAAYSHEVGQFPRYFGGGWSRSGEINSWQGGASWVRQHLLLETIIKTSPPGGFDHLVYQAGRAREPKAIDGRLMIAIANYRRPEAVRFVNVWLQDVLGPVSQMHGRFSHDQRVALGVMPEIDNPELQNPIHQRVRRQFPVTGFGSNYELNEYFVVRISRGDDPDMLASVIADCNGLRVKEKAGLLWQLPCPAAGKRLSMLMRQLTVYELQEFISNVRYKPLNPYCGRFLIEANELLTKQQPNMINGIDTMLLSIETDEATEFILHCLDDYKNNQWSWMVDDVRGPLPHLDWMVGRIAAFEDVGRRQVSCDLLKAIGTESALALLTEWADGSIRSLSGAASKALAEPAESIEAKPINETLLEQAEELIAGRMLPDDLLPPAESLVWTGARYESPEGETAADTTDAIKTTEKYVGEPADAAPAEPVVEVVAMPTLEETIAKLLEEGKTEEAEFLTTRLAFANRFHESQGWRFIFGRLVVNGPENPRMCMAQLRIHESGWFLGSIRDPNKPVGFRLFGYHPVDVVVGDRSGTLVNVGDVTMKPFRSEELATVRGEVLFEGSVDPEQAKMEILLKRPKTNSASGGTSGSSIRTGKEPVTLDADSRFQKTGLAPLEHYVSIKAPKHRLVTRDFVIQPGQTIDLGVIRVPASPQVDIEYAASMTLDFTAAQRHRVSLYDGERFHTNPASDDYRAGGPLTLHQTDGRSQLNSHIHGEVHIDLGQGELDDSLTPDRPDVEEIRDRELDLIDGHVYLIYHHTENWKHWTLLRVKISSPIEAASESKVGAESAATDRSQ